MDHQHAAYDPGARPQPTPDATEPGPEDRWAVPDLIDFEYYLDLDETELREHPAARKTLTDRDRSIYLHRIAPVVAGTKPHTPLHRRWSLRRWLEARRESEAPEMRALLPGAAFARAQQLVIVALAVLGFVLGSGAASALLSYEGRQPVNVAWFIFLLVGVQFLIVAGGALAWTVRKSRAVDSAVQDITMLGRLVRPMFTRVGRWLQHQRLAHVSQEVRDRARAGTGMLKAHYALYGPASYIPVLVPVQVFGVAFNLGVVLATISLVWFSDLAFGWGSTLDIDPQSVYHLARGIATPWRWLFGEGVGFPTLDQVAGSRINLKDPLSLLRAEHLRSWRWFLVLAVFTYGMLPRLALLGAAIYAQRHIVGRLSFTHGRTQALYARMITPHLETAAAVSGHGPEMPIPAPIAPHGHLFERAAGPAAGAPSAAARPEPTAQPGKPTLPPTRVLAPALAPTRAQEPAPAAPPTTEPAAAEPVEPTASEVHFEAPAVRLERPKPEPAPPPVVAPELQPSPAPGPVTGPEVTQRREAVPASEPEAKPITGPKRKAVPEAELGIEPEPQRHPEPIAKPASAPEHELAAQPDSEPETGALEVPGGIATDACLLLIHVDVDELVEDDDRPRLARMLMTHTGWRVAGAASFGSGSAMTKGVVRWVEEQDWKSPPPRVAIVMDGSQPPITENLQFLRELRAAVGARAQILLALVGDPEDDDPLPPVRTFDFTDWQRKIDAMGDPYLRLEMLAPPNENEDR